MSDDPSPPPSTNAPSKRVKLTRTLPTDRIAFLKQSEILRAFAAAYDKSGAPVANEEVGRFVGMAASTVSQIIPFFTDVGLLQRAEAGKFIPSSASVEYFKLFQFSPERAWGKLAPIFERSWFGQELIGKLKFRPLDEQEAIADLALASNAEVGYEAQLKIAIEWLILAGLAIREGSQIKLNPQGPTSFTPVSTQATPNGPLIDESEHEDCNDLLKSTLPLDPSSKRRLVVWAPPTITAKELERIKKWLEVQLIVEGAD